MSAIKSWAEVHNEKAEMEWKTLSKINVFDRGETGTASVLFQAGTYRRESHQSLG